MSKSKKNSPSAEKFEVPAHVTKAHLDAIAARRRAWFEKNRKQLSVLALLFLCGSAFAGFFLYGIAIAKTAVLYIFALNGKFSGRMDGNVMMSNGRSRGYVNPALVRNSYTMTQRGIFAVLSASYRGLTQAQILAWNNTELGATNRMGQAIVVKGKELYIRLNANLIDVGAATISDPPVFTAVPAILSIISLAADASAGTIALDFSASPTAANVDHLVFATAPLSPGVSRPSSSAYRLVDVIPGTSNTPWALGTAYVNKFGAITGQAGNKIFVQLYGVENTTGQKVPSVGESAVIVP